MALYFFAGYISGGLVAILVIIYLLFAGGGGGGSGQLAYNASGQVIGRVQ
jgi:hypothetical protein